MEAPKSIFEAVKAAIIIANCVRLELSNLLPCLTVKGWAKVNVTYPDVYAVESMEVDKYGSTREFNTCLVLIDYFVKYMTRKTQNQKKGKVEDLVTMQGTM